MPSQNADLGPYTAGVNLAGAEGARTSSAFGEEVGRTNTTVGRLQKEIMRKRRMRAAGTTAGAAAGVATLGAGLGVLGGGGAAAGGAGGAGAGTLPGLGAGAAPAGGTSAAAATGGAGPLGLSRSTWLSIAPFVSSAAANIAGTEDRGVTGLTQGVGGVAERIGYERRRRQMEESPRDFF